MGLSDWLESNGLVSRIALYASLALAAVLTLAVLITPLDLVGQWIFAAGMIVPMALLQFRVARRATLIICMISLMASTRYIWWRATHTLGFEHSLGLVLGGGLFLAELFAWLIHVLGLFQTVWPLRRPPVALSGADADLPTVDIFIPTYNEDLSIVQSTVFAAMAIDYPAEKLRVYILDDGRRPEFRRFAQYAGCGYMTRSDNKHAKAGNMNAALPKTNGELICIFDCDHVAVRAFLQMTVGWFQRDKELAMLQTPHHFYSQDPVQRNFTFVGELPGESELFYDVVQDGNDFWNASFFCGSCAIIRRSALDEIGGFAGETVTEDAHTALKLQRRGWRSAYLNVKLSAGLATEKLALHIGQRARWARGMTQMLRIDNPLFGPGLTWPQRLCYLNAMLHFQFPLPRIVFLTSPLAFLLAGQSVISAAAPMIFAYAAPHLFGAMIATHRLQGGKRRLFWSEIYESLLAFHLLRPTIETLINPKGGKFNVTAKGGLIKRAFFDYSSVAPHLFVIALLVIGIVVGIVKLFTDQAELWTVVMNLAWSAFSLLILVSAVMVARETLQQRHAVRVEAALPVTLYFDNGMLIDAFTDDASIGGLAVRVPKDLDIADKVVTDVEIRADGRNLILPVKVAGKTADVIRLSFENLTFEQRRGLSVAVFGRSDAWEGSDLQLENSMVKAA